MKAIIGICVVLGAVIGGYLMGHGNLAVLYQPAEFVIIFGAAIGSFIIGTPGHLLAITVKDIMKIFTHKGLAKKSYVDLLMLLYELCSKARKEGIIAIEKDIEDFDKSEIFKRYKQVTADHHTADFIRDNFRALVMGMQVEEISELLEIDMETSKKESLEPAHGVARIADSLPGLGIVAAVLGVVLTMGKINEPPEVLGHHIGAALVGTFLGVLACYGFAGPIASSLEHMAKERETYLGVIKVALQRFDSAPAMAIEAARREIPLTARPSFKEMEETIKQWKGKK
jgi:chemotaxis protein MotA